MQNSKVSAIDGINGRDSLAERLETTEKANDVQRQMLDAAVAALAITTISLTACATGVSEQRIVTVCPPVVEYTREFQARAAEELGTLPDGSATAEMLSDYAVIREQARACR